jgi:hypothetical protein
MKRASVVVALISFAAAVHAIDQVSFGFYVVSDKPAPGLHFVELSTLAKLGYIAEKPDLPILQLES